ncbi:hypothetical protein CK203_098972 [Vitis vinifera]|uniref:Retrotransposon gag domain-containing protein n=1 Tax=Vitis vinifera TaxID=29760 RepID=A0A438CV59_VITVI|nr:hypothetical protein CK203_098972 [Vitis vinifera]
MAFGRQLLQACAKFAQHLEIRTTPSACAKLVRNSHNTFQIRTAHAWKLGEKSRCKGGKLRALNTGLCGCLLLDPYQSISYHVSCNLCMPYWIRDQEGRLVRIENPQDTELDICVNIMDPPQRIRILNTVKGLIIRPHIVPLLPNFHGMESENPYAHIKEFEEDKAKIWLNSLRPRSIRNWVDLQAEFLKKFFPTHRTNGLKRQISNFSAKENEKFHECWERYMEAINACPHHGFDTWLLVSYFYDGMSSSMKQILETMCGGDFMSKNPEEAMDFLSYVSEVTRGWDEPNSRNGSESSYECPTMPAVREMLGDQANVVGQFRPNNNAPYGNTYNSSWRNHPNFSWKPRPLHTNHKPKPKHLNKPLQWSKPLRT